MTHLWRFIQLMTQKSWPKMAIFDWKNYESSAKFFSGSFFAKLVPTEYMIYRMYSISYTVFHVTVINTPICIGETKSAFDLSRSKLQLPISRIYVFPQNNLEMIASKSFQVHVFSNSVIICLLLANNLRKKLNTSRWFLLMKSY